MSHSSFLIINKVFQRLGRNFRRGSFFGNFLGNISSIFDNLVIRNIKRFFKKNEDKELINQLSNKNVPSLKQFQQIKYFLSDKERKIVNICIVLFMISSIWFATRLIWSGLVELPKYGGVYTEGVVGSMQYINPVLSSSNDVDRDISKLVFSGLFKMSKDGKIENDLIKDYSVSEDGKTYSFQLKSGIKWHDGNKFTVDDIGFTFSLIQDSNYKSPLYKTFQGVQFEKSGDESFKLTLPETFAQFPSILTFGILPAHLWENISPENFTLAELNKKPIGSGPFKYESFKKGTDGFIKQYKLVAFNDYYDKKPYLAELIFKFYPDSVSLIDALNNGQVSGIGSLAESDLPKIKSSKNYNFNNFDMPRYSALFFNSKQNALLKDADIREALSLSLDKQALAKEIGSTEKAAYGPMDFVINGSSDEFNFDKAKKILESDGWKFDSKDNVLKKKDQKLEITITSVDNSEYVKILQYIKKQWNALGITTNLEIISKQNINSQVIMPRQYQILLHGQLLSYDMDPYPFWHSSQTQTGLNLSIFTSNEIDSILESARKIVNFDDRLTQYKKFEDILKKENFAIFLFRPTYHYIVDTDLKGIDTKVVYISSDRFNNITNWYIKTKKTLKK